MINEFLNYQLKRKGLSTNTLTAYRKDLQRFVAYGKEKGLRWSTITKEDLDDYLSTMFDQGLKPATINRSISSVRNLFTWAKISGLINENPARYLQSHKQADTLPETISPEEIDTYLDKPTTDNDSLIGKALIALLRETGIRIQEAIDIKLSDINTDEKSIIITGKGNKQRKVYYSQRTIDHCCKIAGRFTPYLLPRFEQRDFRQIIARELHTHPHALRHTFATNMLNNGADIKVVSYLLGHASVKTTERYAKVSNTTAKVQYQKFN